MRMQPALRESLNSRPRQPSGFSLSLSFSILSSHFYLAFLSWAMTAAESSFSFALNLFGAAPDVKCYGFSDRISFAISRCQLWRSGMRWSPVSQTFSV